MPLQSCEPLDAEEDILQAERFAPAYVKEDVASILSSIRHEKNMLHAKRRWLMGLPENVKVSKICLNSLRAQTFFSDMFLPESFVRENDVFVEVANTYLRKCFLTRGEDMKDEFGVKETVSPLGTNESVPEAWRGDKVWRVFISVLDELTSSALCELVGIIAPESSNFEKTRPRLECVIKRHLPLIFKTTRTVQKYEGLCTQIEELFGNPNSYREGELPILSRLSSSHRDASDIVQRLDQFPICALDAMRRKLLKSPCTLKVQSFGYRKNELVKMLGKRLMKLQLKMDRESIESIRKVFRIANLYMKCINKSFESPFRESFQLPPNVVELQNEILKAIWCLPEVPLDELKELELLLNPDAGLESEVSSRVLRHRTKASLMLALFHCDEVKIPDTVLKVVSLMNAYSDKRTTKERVDCSLECILNLSSCMKQVVWSLPEDAELSNIDQEFWSAYTEVLGGAGEGNINSDADDNDDVETDENQSSNYEIGQIFRQCGSFTDEASSTKRNPEGNFRTGTCSSQLESPGSTNNKYLKIESICDEVSLFAHKLIGRLIERRLEVEGHCLNAADKVYLRGGVVFSENQDPLLQEPTGMDTNAVIFVQVIKELLPSLSQSQLERIAQVFS